MTLAEILNSLFPAGHDIVSHSEHCVIGSGKQEDGRQIEVIGIVDGAPLGIAALVPLAARVLHVINQQQQTTTKSPILVLVDTQGQRMSRHDEMLGLNEYLSHLAKCLHLASISGHPTVALNYGKAAAGAFLATAGAADILVGLPGAEPAVMDLPSIARVTKLPLDRLTELSQSAPVFAPGLEPMVKVGAVTEVWDPTQSLAVQFQAALDKLPTKDIRDELGAQRGGRTLATTVARKVALQASVQSIAQ